MASRRSPRKVRPASRARTRDAPELRILSFEDALCTYVPTKVDELPELRLLFRKYQLVLLFLCRNGLQNALLANAQNGREAAKHIGRISDIFKDVSNALAVYQETDTSDIKCRWKERPRANDTVSMIHEAILAKPIGGLKIKAERGDAVKVASTGRNTFESEVKKLARNALCQGADNLIAEALSWKPFDIFGWKCMDTDPLLEDWEPSNQPEASCCNMDSVVDEVAPRGVLDKREPVNMTDNLYRGVVRLDLFWEAPWGRKRNHATGCLIGKDTVVTTDHTIAQWQFGRVVAVIATIGYGGDAPKHKMGATIIVPGQWYKFFDSKHDFALIRLREAFDPADAMKLLPNPPGPDETKATIAGYPEDKEEGEKMFKHDGDCYYDSPTSLYKYKIHTGPGNSGSPIIDSNGYVLGIHIGGAQERLGYDGQPRNQGVRFDSNTRDIASFSRHFGQLHPDANSTFRTISRYTVSVVAGRIRVVPSFSWADGKVPGSEAA